MIHHGKLDVASAARLAPAIHLRSVVFTHILAEHLASRGIGKLRFDVQETLATWLRIERQIRAVFPFSVDISTGTGQDGGTPLGRIRVTARLEYEIDAGVSIPDSIDLTHYVGISGYMHAWPYFRAEVQSLSAKIGFPTLVLPTIVSGHVVSRVKVKQVQPAPSLVEETKRPLVVPHRGTRRTDR